MPANQPRPGEVQKKIDLNNASRDELMRIPGITPETADTLIKCRDEQTTRTKGEPSTREQRAAKRDRAEDELVNRLYI
jgi:hypothetical protein